MSDAILTPTTRELVGTCSTAIAIRSRAHRWWFGLHGDCRVEKKALAVA